MFTGAGFVMRQSDVEEIIEDMGVSSAITVSLYIPAEFNPLGLTFFGLEIPVALQPVFWVTVSTWFCERERIDLTMLPDWTPLDLARSVMYVSFTSSPELLYFDGFSWLEDSHAVTR